MPSSRCAEQYLPESQLDRRIGIHTRQDVYYVEDLIREELPSDIRQHASVYGWLESRLQLQRTITDSDSDERLRKAIMSSFWLCFGERVEVRVADIIDALAGRFSVQQVYDELGLMMKRGFLVWNIGPDGIGPEQVLSYKGGLGGAHR